jgi:hypothetical protein
MATAKPDIRQFVKVEFARSLASIVPGEPRHAWHWCIIVQDGHLYTISTGWPTLAEAVQDFATRGTAQVAEVETRLAEIYAGPHEEPYDVAIVNQERVEK